MSLAHDDRESRQPAERPPASELPAAAVALTRDLWTRSPPIYWGDLVVTAASTWGGLALAAGGPGLAARIAGAAVGVLALYRAISFIHEIAHFQRGELRGFGAAWNALIGAPFLVPSFLYEGVHVLHHSRRLYGTAADPEYLPLARYGRGALLGLLLAPVLAPVALALRFGVLTPLALLIPRLRGWVAGRLSSMALNPAFVRTDLGAAAPAAWRLQETACWLWCWALAAGTLAGLIPPAAVLAGAGMLSAAALVNQLRTLVAHSWESAGEPLSLEAQFADTLNVPPPGWAPALWAPLGLRYHALHHLLPRLPYHNLAEAHRRLRASRHAPAYRTVDRKDLLDAIRPLVAR